jgi:hypothetical protein
MGDDWKMMEKNGEWGVVLESENKKERSFKPNKSTCQLHHTSLKHPFTTLQRDFASYSDSQQGH